MEKDIGVKEDGVCFLNCGRSENQACAAECHLRFQFITYISATSMLKITCTIRRRCHNWIYFHPSAIYALNLETK